MIRERLRQLTGGADATPLLVLLGLNFVDEFDRFAFAALTPEIRDAFSLNDTGIGAIAILTGVMVLVSALPMGIVSDRLSRVRLAVAAAIAWGTMSVLTGLVPTVALLVAVRVIAGIGRVTNEVVHPSLLNDYYAGETLPKVFAVHRLANPVSAVSGVIAGGIAVALSWEWAFFLLAIPTFLLIGAASRLREPERGESLDADAAAAVAGESDVSFGEARRRLFAVPTLKRMWAASAFNGVAIIGTAPLLALFYENVYAFGPLGRGFVTFVLGAGTVVGLLVGMRRASDVSETGDVPGLARISGAAGLWFGGWMLVMVVTPWAVVSVLALFVAAIGNGAFQPAYFPLVGRVAPPRLRSQAYAWAILFLAAGALASLPLFSIGDASGYRLALGLLGAAVIVAGVIAWSARQFVTRDVNQAEATLASSVEEQAQDADDRALLVARDVEVAYDQVQVLFGAGLEVHAGEIVALLGTNGAGKSTLLKAISGLVDPIGGTVRFDGRDITHTEARHTAALGIQQMPGGRAVFPDLTVDEHLRLAGWLEEDPEATADAVDRALQTFPILAERRHQQAGELSGGEQQMLGLAVALVTRPKLLMIDELSLGLAPTIVEQLLDVVREIRDQGTAVVVVEQSVNVALSLAERAYFMEKGETRFDGRTEDLLERDDLLRSVFLEGAGVADGSSDAPTAKVRDRRPVQERGDHEALLEVDGLTRSFGGITAVDSMALEVRPGEILGIIGPNGAGKTTLFDLISGYVTPDSGQIRLRDRDVTRLTPHARAHRGLGRSFQDARLVPSLTTAENLAIGLERHLVYHDHLAAALAMPGILDQEVDVAYTVDDLVELMGLGAYRDKFVRELSTGTRRVVDLAMVIAHDPDVLLLDEPSSGIAQREAEALGPLLDRIRDETGCAMLVIEHDMPLITGVADRLIAMDLGRKVTEGAPDEVTSHPDVVESYLGGDVAAVTRSGAMT